MANNLERGSGRGLGNMVLRSSAWLVGARLGRILITLAGTAVLSRLLTPADFGLFFFAITAMALVVIVLEGFIDFPITRDDGLSLESIRSLLWAALILIGAFSLLVWTMAPRLENLLGFDGLAVTLRAMIPTFFAQIPLTAGSAILKRQHRFAFVAATQVLNVALYIGFACAFVLSGMDLVALLIAINIAQIVTGAMLAWAARLPAFPPATFALPEGVRSAGAGAASRFIGWVWTNLDTLAVSYLFGPAATGLYSRAYNLNVQAKEPFAAIDQPIRQAFAALKHRDDGFASQAVLGLRLLTLLTGITAAAMILLREAIILILLGPQWPAAALPFAILAGGLPARVARLYIDSVAIAAGSMRALLYRSLLVTAMMLAGLAWLAPLGLGWVAGVVTAVVYGSLLFTDRRAPPNGRFLLTDVIAAIAPGMAIGVAVMSVGLGFEAADLSFATEIAAKLLLLGGVCALMLFAVPDSWLGPQIASKRALLYVHKRKGR